MTNQLHYILTGNKKRNNKEDVQANYESIQMYKNLKQTKIISFRNTEKRN